MCTYVVPISELERHAFVVASVSFSDGKCCFGLGSSRLIIKNHFTAAVGASVASFASVGRTDCVWKQ